MESVFSVALYIRNTKTYKISHALRQSPFNDILGYRAAHTHIIYNNHKANTAADKGRH